MELKLLLRIVDERLVLSNAKMLGMAKPPFTPGVYALFFQSERVYVGVARGRKGSRNRKRNYVGGDDGHTTHREFLSAFPNKIERSAFICANVAMAWFETETANIAEELESELISVLRPRWNRIFYG